MHFLELSPNQLDKHRNRLIRFIKQHGDNRITHRAIRWLSEADADQLLFQEGTAIIVALENNRLRGTFIISNYGIDEAFVVVHRDHRSQNTGKNLIQQYLNTRNKLYGKVALDNIASMKMCLANGMVAFKMTDGPTGKPTLWFGSGNWKKEDIER